MGDQSPRSPAQQEALQPEKEQEHSRCSQWDAERGEDEDMLVSDDSLELSDHRHDEQSPLRGKVDYLQAHMNESKRLSQQLCDDEDSDLRYDSNWRTSLRGAGCFHRGTDVSAEELPNVSLTQSGDQKQPVSRAGYRRVSGSSTAPALPAPSGRSYHLHLQDHSSSASSRMLSQQPQLGSSDAELPRASTTSAGSDSGLQSRSSESQSRRGERRPELVDHLQAMNIRDGRSGLHRHSERRAAEAWLKGTTPPSSVKGSGGKLPAGLKDSVVQRNKRTLGRNPPKGGAYARAPNLQQEIPRHGEQGPTNMGAREDGSASRLRPLQTSQQPKVSQTSRRKKGQQQKPPSDPPGSGLIEEQGACSCLSQSRTQGLSPTIHLHLNSASSMLPATLQGLGWTSANQRTQSRSNLWSPRDQAYLEVTHHKLETRPGLWHRADCLTRPPELHLQHLEPTPPTEPGKGGPGPRPGQRGGAGLSPGQRGGGGLRPGQRSSSDGYLVQREKQQQMKSRPSDKKLQNQTMRRILLPVSEDPEVKDKKLLRTKALEYAKTVPRPALPPRGTLTHSPGNHIHLGGGNGSQIHLELLRKRHEEEKLTVTLLRKKHAV